MKTNAKSFLILFVLITVAFIPARADFIKSTYTGPTEGNWGDPANWSPAIVPNNGGGNTFAVSIANVFLTLDLDVAVNRLRFEPAEQRRFSIASIIISPRRTPASATAEFFLLPRSPKT